MLSPTAYAVKDIYSLTQQNRKQKKDKEQIDISISTVISIETVMCSEYEEYSMISANRSNVHLQLSKYAKRLYV